MNLAENNEYPGNPAINASVSASAGTGKTYLLVSRIIRLLLAGSKPESILALTFTRKASGEMQQRLSERLWRLAALDSGQLESELQNCGITETSAELLTQARQLYERILFADRNIRISTFHAFCQELLQRFPLETDIPPGFELIENTALFEEIAWHALFLEVTQSPNSPLAESLEILFNACRGLQNTQDALIRGFLNHRSDWWAYTENQNNPIEYAIKQLEQLLTYTENPSAQFLQHYQQDLLEFTALLAMHDTATNLKDIANIHNGLAAQKSEQAYETICQSFLTQKGEIKSRSANKTLMSKMGETNVTRYLQLHESISAAILTTQDELLENDSLLINKAWYHAGLALLSHYQRIKRERRSLDFADLEWESYKLLRHPDNVQWIQYKVDQKIDHLLIDEFQDTNPTQWQLILPILEEIASGNTERKRSVFLVGDPKQSIYGFRRANPKLQNAANLWLQQNLQAQQFSLSHSRRSAPAIIQALNAVFQNTEIGQLLGDYPVHQTYESNTWGHVEILPLIQNDNDLPQVDSKLRNPLLHGRPAVESTLHYMEGIQVAEEIQKLILNRTSIGNSSDAKLLDYNDIIILMRNRTHAQEYERALSERNIPYTSIERGSLLNSQEVSDIEALLSYLITPYNNLLLAQVLRSPLFLASDTDLILLANTTNSSNWLERLKFLHDNNKASQALLRAHQLLQKWQALAGHLPVHDLLDRIYHQGNVLARYKSTTPESLQNRVIANLNRFIEMALEVDSGRYPSMTDFVSRIKKMRSSEQESGDAPPHHTQQSRVRLMTIHAAKGLEASAVFLVNSASLQKSDYAYNAIIEWPADANKPSLFLLALDKSRQATKIKLVLEQQSLKEKAEQANLLYVALTRAKQLLFISACAATRIDKEDVAKLGWYGEIIKNISDHCSKKEDGRYQFSNGVMPSSDPIASEKISGFANYNNDLNHSFSEKINSKNVILPSQQNGKVDLEESTQNDIEQTRGIYIHYYLQQLSLSNRDLSSLQINTSSQFVHNKQLIEWQDEARRTFENPRFAELFDKERYTEAWSEIPISYRDSNGKLAQGIIDRLIRKDNKLWLIDYKTHANASSDNLKQIADTYRNQMLYYTAGLKNVFPGSIIQPAIIFTACQELYLFNA